MLVTFPMFFENTPLSSFKTFVIPPSLFIKRDTDAKTLVNPYPKAAIDILPTLLTKLSIVLLKVSLILSPESLTSIPSSTNNLLNPSNTLFIGPLIFIPLNLDPI